MEGKKTLFNGHMDCTKICCRDIVLINEVTLIQSGKIMKNQGNYSPTSNDFKNMVYLFSHYIFTFKQAHQAFRDIGIASVQLKLAILLIVSIEHTCLKRCKAEQNSMDDMENLNVGNGCRSWLGQNKKNVLISAHMHYKHSKSILNQ